MDEFCGRCGKNLTEMGAYSDFVHYVPYTKDWCITLEDLYGPEEVQLINAELEVYVAALSVQLTTTLDKIMGSE